MSGRDFLNVSRRGAEGLVDDDWRSSAVFSSVTVMIRGKDGGGIQSGREIYVDCGVSRGSAAPSGNLSRFIGHLIREPKCHLGRCPHLLRLSRSPTAPTHKRIANTQLSLFPP